MGVGWPDGECRTINSDKFLLSRVTSYVHLVNHSSSFTRASDCQVIMQSTGI